MNALKDAIVIQNKAFMENLSSINDNMIKDQGDLRAKNNDLSNQLNQLLVRSQDQKGNIDQIFERMQTAEDKLTEINALTIDLGIKKCDNSKFEENIERID